MRQQPAGALVAAAGGLLTTLNLVYAQPLQPEVLFSFPTGPAYPQGNLVQGDDGSFYAG